jgi:hypothetical protein
MGDSMAGTVTILDPRVRPADDAGSPTYDVATSLHGVIVGLRLDRSWRSYMTVVEEWERMLRADGADVRVLWTGERVGDEGETTRADLEEWSKLVDAGVVGLGN